MLEVQTAHACPGLKGQSMAALLQADQQGRGLAEVQSDYEDFLLHYCMLVYVAKLPEILLVGDKH